MRNQPHLRLTRGARSHVQHRHIGFGNLRANPLKNSWIFAHLFLAQRTHRIVGQQHPPHIQRVARGSILERLHHFFVFDENNCRIRSAQRFHLIRIRQAGVQRRRDRTRCHHADIGEIELRARLRLQRDHAALGHAQFAHADGNLLYRVAIFAPRPGTIFSSTERLVQRRFLRVLRGCFFKHRVNGPGLHPHNATMLGNAVQSGD